MGAAKDAITPKAQTHNHQSVMAVGHFRGDNHRLWWRRPNGYNGPGGHRSSPRGYRRSGSDRRSGRHRCSSGHRSTPSHSCGDHPRPGRQAPGAGHSDPDSDCRANRGPGTVGR